MVALQWPLVGRMDELRFVTAALRSRPVAPGVVLAGPAGVGKTRLAREALAGGGPRRVPIRWATATASSRVLPLGAFTGLLGDVGRDQSRVLSRAAEALLVGAGRSGVIVGVDDAHLLDDLSATLLHQLVQGRAATVLVTVRIGEPAPDAVTALWRDQNLDRLEVRPLSEPEIAQLLEAVLGGQVDRSAVTRLWTMSGGNVFYLRQLVDGAIATAALRRESGVWCLAEAPPITPGLVDLVAVRIGALSGPVREVVDILALAEPLGTRLLGDLTDPAAVELAEDLGVVRVEADGRRLQARLAHPLYGEVRRAGIGQLRARRLRGRTAEALAATGSRRADDILRRAVLTVDSDLDGDPELLVAAAERAAYLGDLALAQRLARLAVRAGEGFRAQAVVAKTTGFIGSLADADTELAALTRLASTDAEVAQAALSRAKFLAFMVARPEHASAVLDEAMARINGLDDRLELVAIQGMIDGQAGRVVRAEQAALGVLGAGAPTDDAVLIGCCAMVAALAVTGRADQIGEHVERGVDAATRSAERASFWVPLIALQMTGLRLAGHVREAARVANDCNEQIKGVPLGTQIGCYLMGEAALASGRAATAIRWLREGRAGVEPFGDTGGWRYSILIALTRALALMGDTGAARTALADLDRHRHAGLALMDPEMTLARAWVAAGEGALSQAIPLAHQAAALAGGRGQLAHVVLALHTAVRFGDRTLAGRLAALAPRVSGPFAPAAAGHATALAAGDGAGLLAASDAFAEMGDLTSAVDAAAQASAGDHQVRHLAAGRVRTLAEVCEGARTPALAATTTPLPLTGREREIVTLAAHGLSNRQIADRLVVSVRTVEGHLYRASAKLGTSNRAEFVTLLDLAPG